MYTILMHDDKTLSASHKTNIYQHDNLADKIQFLFPTNCGEIDLTTCSVLLRYIDQGNIPHEEPLIIDEELYKNHIRATFDVKSTELTYFAGDVDIHLCFIKVTDDASDYVALQTGDITITVLPRPAAFTPVQTSQSALANLMIQIEAQRKQTQQAIEALSAGQETLQREKADNITYVDNKIQLTANNQEIGDIVEVETCDGECVKDGIPVVEFYGNEEDESNTEIDNVVEF